MDRRKLAKDIYKMSRMKLSISASALIMIVKGNIKISREHT